MVKRKILIIGTTPSSAGIGGVTIHVERLLHYFDNEGIYYELCDYKIESFATIIIKIKKADIVHQHVCNPYLMYFISLLCHVFHKKLITTLHGKYVQGVQKPWTIIKRSVKLATVPVVLNQDSFVACSKINSKTTLIPAFIPPQKDEQLEPSIINIIENIQNHGNKIVTTYGCDIIYDTNGEEVYGIGFLINFFKNKTGYSLIVSDPKGSYSQKYFGFGNNIYFIDHPHPLYELMKKTDVFVRNTSKDGDSLSVREALYLGKRVLCSDVVERPEGVELFKYNDLESFKTCLEKGQVTTAPLVESGAEKIVELYKKFK